MSSSLVRYNCRAILRSKVQLSLCGLTFTLCVFCRTDADRGRQLQLSAQRCEARADRINIGQSYHKQSDEYAWPRKGKDHVCSCKESICYLADKVMCFTN